MRKVGSVSEVGRKYMKNGNILTKKVKQCLTGRNIIYDVSLMGFRGLEWYAREVIAPGRAGPTEQGGGGRGRWWHAKSPLARFLSCEGRQIYEFVFVVLGLFSSALLTISESMYALLLPTLHRYSKAFSEILIVMACVRPVEGRPVPKAVPAFMVLEFSYVII